MTAQRLASAFWIAFGIVITILSWKLELWSASGPRSGFFPFLAGATIAVGGVMSAFEPARTVNWPSIRGAYAIGTVIAALVIIALTAELVGFLATSAVCAVLLIASTGAHRWYSAILWGLGISAAIYFMFTRILDVPLPRGVLGI